MYKKCKIIVYLLLRILNYIKLKQTFRMSILPRLKNYLKNITG